MRNRMTLFFLVTVVVSLSACGPQDHSSFKVATKEELKAENDRQKLARLSEIMTEKERVLTECDGEFDFESAALVLKNDESGEGSFRFSIQYEDREAKTWEGRFVASGDSTEPDLALEGLGTLSFLRPEKEAKRVCALLRMDKEVTGHRSILICEASDSPKS